MYCAEVDGLQNDEFIELKTKGVALFNSIGKQTKLTKIKV
jgi:hypothetical protein